MKLFCYARPAAYAALLLSAPALLAQRSDRLIGQVLSDMNRAVYSARLDQHEREHFDRAALDLQEFERRWETGDFDKNKLDGAIENLDHLARADRVHPRDRDVLRQDLAALRNFRSTRGGGYGGYDRGYAGAPYEGARGYSTNGNGGSLPLQVIQDLGRASRGQRLDDHEVNHVEQAIRNLEEFEGRWSQGDFDKGKLDRAIENIDHLANADRVRGRDRDMLWNDLTALREFRSRRGQY